MPDGIGLHVDPDQMARILINLIKNAREALEANQSGSGQPQITCDFAEDTDGIAHLGLGQRSPVCRHGRARTCSSLSKARHGPVAPGSVWPSPAN